MVDISIIQKAILNEALEGWLFFNFDHRDKIANKILKINKESLNSRPWCYLIPAQGSPLKIVPKIESSVLDHLPGQRLTYSSREELEHILCSQKYKKIAIQFSKTLPVISFLDYGTVLMLKEAGYTLFSSASLIQRLIGVLDSDGITSHQNTALHLYDIVQTVWDRIKKTLLNNESITEGIIQTWIMNEFSNRDLVTTGLPIVAAGTNSADPHYSPKAAGAALKKGNLLQLDIWAKSNKPNSIYADISWICFLSDIIPVNIEKAFKAVSKARDEAVVFLKERIENNKQVQGFEIDKKVRSVLIDMGYENYIFHRTGHGIDTNVHGSGVNIDSIEFPDQRYLIEGSCFSIEPGLYLKDFGVRTEINLYIHNNKAVISGGNPQTDILKF